MITCQHSRQLFDRYLDGELSASLQAELHAHQLSCSACQSELAMIEACGDVVLLDRCEPKLSDSFTDRVMLARRAQLAGRGPRRSVRVALLTGAPLSAAASILLAVTLLMPAGPGKVAGKAEKVPGIVSDVTNKVNGVDERSAEARKEFENTPEMAASGFMEALLATGSIWTEDRVEDARGGLGEFRLLFQRALADHKEMLAARWQSSDNQDASNDSPGEASGGDWPFLTPPLEGGGSDNDSSVDSLLDPL